MRFFRKKYFFHFFTIPILSFFDTFLWASRGRLRKYKKSLKIMLNHYNNTHTHKTTRQLIFFSLFRAFPCFCLCSSSFGTEKNNIIIIWHQVRVSLYINTVVTHETWSEYPSLVCTLDYASFFSYYCCCSDTFFLLLQQNNEGKKFFVCVKICSQRLHMEKVYFPLHAVHCCE